MTLFESPAIAGREFDQLRVRALEFHPDPCLILDRDRRLLFANEAAEALFGQRLGSMFRGSIRTALPLGSPLADLMERCAALGIRVRERDVRVEVVGSTSFVAEVTATPMDNHAIMVTLRPGARTSPTDRLSARSALSSISGMGRMLAHEIKNPLAGIRGAAQLLKAGLQAADVPLAQVIVDETERIRRLVDRMDVLCEDAPGAKTHVNVHRVLDRVRALTANGAASGLIIHEAFDPSLPPAWGDEDQLIQIFLNLMKNAAEAAHARGDGRGEITLSTAYRHGVRINRGAGGSLRPTPLEVGILDNGPGIPAHLRETLFDPFVTGKAHGTGLGLALVAKMVANHDGLVHFDSEAGRTQFRVLLPISAQTKAA